ncbi:kelch-like protein 7 [Plakobranchus ocellatus]|uniref:Kelch-like protein 7, partial n=1 Tax=Plakobranchus ocellatus TaxID=259542 RepID=A0AAV4CN12_9GAST|nr:kelch-like protein 7 [Plakobranchus ocellatus]
MGETTLEFGVYQGQTFRWALENATGWVVALVASEVAETPQTSNIGINKGLLMQYASHFPKVREEVDFRKALNASVAKVKATGDVGFTLVRFGQYREATSSTSSDQSQGLTELSISSPAESRLLKAVTRQTPASSTERLLSLKEMVPADEDELALVQLRQEVEAKEVVAADTTTDRPTSGELQTKSFTESTPVTLRKDWRKSLPAEDHLWVSKAIFQDSGRLKDQLQMWYYPPQPAAVYSQPPASANVFFTHRFFLWMPYRIWGTRFHCSKPECRRQQLASCGLYKTVRRVIDLSDDYYMGAEYLECGKCHKKLPSWSMDILGQLDPAHRSYFPAVLTYHLALDKRVVALLRDRSLGNSSTQLARKLQEIHTQDYLERKLR